MKKEPTVAVIDGNWMMNRAMSVIDGRSEHVETRLPSLVLDFCCSASLRCRADIGVLCIDGPSNFRYDVYPDYKKSRRAGKGLATEDHQSQSKEVYDYLPAVTSLFDQVGFPWLQLEKYEADDLMTSAAQHFPGPVFMVARDKDVRQGVTDRCTLYTPAVGTDPEVFLTPVKLRELTGMTAEQHLDYQILVGDAIDDVPPILSKAKAKALLKTHGTLKNFFDTPEGTRFLRENQPELLRNRQLVRLARKMWPKDFNPRTFAGLSPSLPKWITSKSYFALRSLHSMAGRSLF